MTRGSPTIRLSDAPAPMGGASARSTQAEWESLACLSLASVVVWLLRHPYNGIYHDGVIYALLAAHWLAPEAYAGDPFFMFGSQDAFSFFSPLYGTLAEWVGLGNAALGIVLAGGALWIAAVISLGRAVFGDSLPMRVAVLVCAWLTVSYSPNFTTFLVTENFATARIIAQPLVLLAIAAAIGGRWRWAWACAVAATALHPLMGIWAPLLIVAVHLSDRMLLVGIVSTMLVVALGSQLSTLPPLQVMSPEWAGDVRQASIDVFVGPWGVFRLNELLFWIVALLLGGRLGSAQMRRWYQVTALLAVSALGVSQLCSYWHPVQIVMQAQPWRVMWLAIVVGVVALADVVWTSAQRCRSAYYWSALVALCLLLWPTATSVVLLLVWLLNSAAVLEPLAAGLEKLYAAHRIPALAVLAALVLVVAPGFLLNLEMAGQGSLAYPWWHDNLTLRGLLLAGGEGMTLVGLAILAGHAVVRRLLMLVLLPALLLVFMHWDHRLPQVREAEARYLRGVALPFGVAIKAGEVVAWPDGEPTTWFELGTANYVYRLQGVGSVFSHEKLREVRRRSERMREAACADRFAVAGAQSGHPESRPGSPADNGQCEARAANLSIAGVRYLCADPVLDWVVSGRNPTSESGPAAASVEKRRDGLRYLHDCRRLRGGIAGNASMEGRVA